MTALLVRGRWFPVLGALALAVPLAGCGIGNGLYNAPLPGGADVGSHPYSVVAEFADAEDLVPQSGVKVNDVAVGRVTKIDLDRAGKTAEVTVELNASVHLPANAVAAVQQTSLLGEKYVSLSAPLGSAPVGRLADHARIPKARTTNGVEVEQVLGALSLLLNGGGIGQLHDIAHELNQFASGHEEQIRTFFTGVDKVVGALNDRRSSITRALDALGTLSGTLKDQNDRIRTTLQSLAPGIDVIADQRRQLTGALDALNDLSTVTVRTLKASQSDIVADFKALAPILTQLADAGSALPKSLQLLLTFPFTDRAIDGIKGDFLNTYATLILQTKGGRIYSSSPVGATDATGSTRSPQARANSASGPPVVATPAGLLPATSSAASGLPSTLTLSPTSSNPASSSGGSSSDPSRAPGSGSPSTSDGSSSGGSDSASSSPPDASSGTSDDAPAPDPTGGGN